MSNYKYSILRLFVYQNALIRYFTPNFLLQKKPLWIHNTGTHIQKMILYTKTSFKDFCCTKINLSQKYIYLIPNGYSKKRMRAQCFHTGHINLFCDWCVVILLWRVWTEGLPESRVISELNNRNKQQHTLITLKK